MNTETIRELVMIVEDSRRRWLQSEAEIQQLLANVKQSVYRRALTDHRLKGKGRRELDVVAYRETLRDARTQDNLDEQKWMWQRIQSAHAYIEVMFRADSLGLLKRGDGASVPE